MNNGDFISILLIALGLSTDCFAVALSGGIANINHSWSRALRVSFSFGIFQALMPVLGWLAGRSVIDFVADFGHWAAFVFLVIVGGRMLWGAFRPEQGPNKEVDITKGILLITLSIATSIDALAVGLSLAFLEVNIVFASVTIGVVAFLVTTAGFLAGKRSRKIIGKRAEAVGGVILLAIAIRILLSHVL